MSQEASAMTEVEKMVQTLLQIGINFRNWSRLLDPNRPSDPPYVTVSKKKECSNPVIKVLAEGDVEVSTISSPDKRSSQKRSSKEVVVESSAATDEDRK